jgi:hypothetical protein
MVELGQDMKMYILNEIPDVRKMLQMTVAFGMLIEPHFDLARTPSTLCNEGLVKGPNATIRYRNHKSEPESKPILNAKFISRWE